MSPRFAGPLSPLMTLVFIVVTGCQATATEQPVSSPALAHETQTTAASTASDNRSLTDAPFGSDGTCPTRPVAWSALVAMDPTARLRCLGADPITVIAYVPLQEHICGDTGIDPDWLGGCSEVVALSAEASDFATSLAARVHPSTGLLASDVPQRRWVQVTGHHDDPSAPSCRQTPGPGEIAQPVEATILECRRQFVITELRAAASP